ncbi:hypothetical protein DFH28DRAFT_980983 [Melampsora americana]|nr:hypothetical protein DFH28DRAFT_980983 [Melampsora americana]
MALLTYLLAMMIPSYFLMITSFPMESHWDCQIESSISNIKGPEIPSLDLSLKLGSGSNEPSHNHIEKYGTKYKSIFKHSDDTLPIGACSTRSGSNFEGSHLQLGHQNMNVNEDYIPREVHTGNLFNIFPIFSGLSFSESSENKIHEGTHTEVVDSSFERHHGNMNHVVQPSPSFKGDTNPIFGMKNLDSLSNQQVDSYLFNVPLTMSQSSGKRQKVQSGISHKPVGLSSAQYHPRIPTTMSFEKRKTPISQSPRHIESISMQDNQARALSPSQLIKLLVRHGLSTAQSDTKSMIKVDSWFSRLDYNMKRKWDIIYGPQNDMSLLIEGAVRKAKTKFSMGFIACLELVYFESPNDLGNFIFEGWRFILKLLENWKTIDLESILQSTYTNLGRSTQKVDSTALFKYLIGLEKESNPSVGFYCNLYNTWAEEATNIYGHVIEEMTWKEFDQKIRKALMRIQDHGRLEYQKKLLGPSTSNIHDPESLIELGENEHAAQIKKQYQSKSQRQAPIVLRNIGLVWQGMSKPTDHLDSFYKWLAILLKETQDILYASGLVENFKLNKASVFTQTCYNLVSYFLTILVLLHPSHTGQTDHQVMIDGLIFLKSYLVHWRQVKVDKLTDIPKVQYTRFCENLHPSVLLKYVINVSTHHGRRISLSMFQSIWSAWSHWNESKITHKIYIKDSVEFMKALGTAAVAKLNQT